MHYENYFQWLTAETKTKWWHDSAIPEEISAALENGALGVTTNPVLTYKTLQARPDFWQDRMNGLYDDMCGAERAEAYLKAVAVYAADLVYPVYIRTNGLDGYALGQLDPTYACDPDKMLAMAKRVRSWAPNIAVKLPTTHAGLDVVEELASLGYPICTTINFSVSQAVLAAERHRKGSEKALRRGIRPAPCFAVQQVGRLDDYLRDVAKDTKADIEESDILHAGIAVAKRSYAIYREQGYKAVIMPAGLRGPYHLTELAGGSMTFSIHPRVQSMIIENDLPFETHIDDEIDKKILERLKTMPEFIKAYEPDGLSVNEYISYGPVQKTLSQFIETGWAMLEGFDTDKASSRWI